MVKVLFVCVENSCRSQMAEAFAKMKGKGVIEAYSSGSKPSGKVNPKAITAMEALDYDMSSHTSKGLNQVPALEYDYVITMGCGDSCPHIPAKNRLDWDLPDPKNMNEEEFFKVRDDIGRRVDGLIDLIDV